MNSGQFVARTTAPRYGRSDWQLPLFDALPTRPLARKCDLSLTTERRVAPAERCSRIPLRHEVLSVRNERPTQTLPEAVGSMEGLGAAVELRAHKAKQ